ncbi:LysM peptidoglycan-binding domain-containing protein [Ornithinimicrobium pekingense]|uniref:LysM domain-containing protein n=1 Tax=Ornithinimicrobium pekingense TaxID=384677 RepID=A0ABQ2F9S5_9MICO|nr:LysM peptidoglycan-binding domain-containing protein [Ornithinimicrobium pekingense]GGK67609.1 hypothetical protein GCM10011509_14970 [Ornithinimicrobium pekingense]
MSTAVVDLFPVAAGARERATDVPAGRPGGHLRLVAADERRVQPAPLHITRRGRLTLTATVALVLVLALASLVSALSPAGATSAVVVEPGMTLSQIAAEQLPELPLDRAVVDIQRANRLSTTDIAVGQELVIPGR